MSSTIVFPKDRKTERQHLKDHLDVCYILFQNSMQGTFYPKNVPASPSLAVRGNNTPIQSTFDDDDYSNNVLNIGFIC